jgi:hypothetical protein
MLNMIEDLTLETEAIKKKLAEEFERHWKFMNGVLGHAEGEKELPRVDKRKYARYLLTEGTTEEKRALLACLKNKITLKDGTLKIDEQKLNEKLRKS